MRNGSLIFLLLIKLQISKACLIYLILEVDDTISDLKLCNVAPPYLSFKAVRYLISSTGKLSFKRLSKYVNYTEDFVYKYSLYGYRPIPLKDINADRYTKIVTSTYNGIKIYSIMDGKYISAPLIAKNLVNLICKEHQIKKLQ